ncbi:hypothetical protein WLU64_25260, partial [Bordetella bronchiseptica]
IALCRVLSRVHSLIDEGALCRLTIRVPVGLGGVAAGRAGVDERGIAAFVVAAGSARIGEAVSSYRDGVISRANRTAQRLGAMPGAPALQVLQAWAMGNPYRI